MRWLTREWAYGGISEEEDDYNQAYRDYEDNLKRVTPELPPNMRFLFGYESGFSLHDATFIGWPAHDEVNATLIMDFMAYDYASEVLIEQQNAWYQPDLHIRIVYRDVELRSPNSYEALQYIVRSAKSEIVHTEIEKLPTGRFVNSFLLLPRKLPYFTVEFSDAAVRVVRFDGDEVAVLRGSDD